MNLPDTSLRWRQLARAALISLVVHFIAGLAMAVVLRHGLDTNADRSERIALLACPPYRVAWVLAWLSWNFAALSILFYYWCFARVLEQRDGGANPWPRFAVYVCAAAVPLDLAAEAIEMGLLPALACEIVHESPGALHQAKTAAFFTWHRAAVMLTGFAANGLYTLSAVILASCGRGLFPRWTSAAAAVVGIGGFLLSLAALLDWVAGMVIANVAFLPALLLWQTGVWQTSTRNSTTV